MPCIWSMWQRSPSSTSHRSITRAADRWREITKNREKYKSIDLANPGSSEKRLYDALDQTVDELNFQETPLRDVINQLKDKYDIPILADKRAFEDAGLDLDTTVVTQNVSGISLRSALRLILGDIDLTYLIKDEVMLITTKDKAAENLVIKVYPVGDLVMPLSSGGVNPFQTGGGMGGARRHQQRTGRWHRRWRHGWRRHGRRVSDCRFPRSGRPAREARRGGTASESAGHHTSGCP